MTVMNNVLFEDHDYQITTIDTSFVRPHLAASHLIIEGQEAAYVDCGTSHSASHLLETLHLKKIPVENVKYVIVTHVHLDHAGGAGKLMQLFPQAQLVVHPRGAKHMIDPTLLIEGATAVYGKTAFQSHYGEITPVPEARVIEAGEGDTVALNGRTLTFVDTPGHARHHFCIFDEHSQSFFTGDTFGISYREFDTEAGAFIFATTTPVQLEPDIWHQSIDRLMTWQPKAMYLTHYGKVIHVSQLANKLHHSINKLVEIITSVGDSGDQRHTLLIDTIMNYFLEELKVHSCRLPKETCRRMLTMDATLNAQGLELWWDKHHK